EDATHPKNSPVPKRGLACNPAGNVPALAEIGRKQYEKAHIGCVVGPEQPGIGDERGYADCGKSRPAAHRAAPKRPVGRSKRIRMNTRGMPICPSCSPSHRPQSDSTMPMIRPPNSAPLKLPMPPSATIVNEMSTKACPELGET